MDKINSVKSDSLGKLSLTRGFVRINRVLNLIEVKFTRGWLDNKLPLEMVQAQLNLEFQGIHNFESI